MLDLLTRVVNLDDNDPRDEPFITVASPTTAGSLSLIIVPLAEFLWGDRLAGWLRDETGVGQWAVDAGFDETTMRLQSGVLIHAYWQLSPFGNSFLVGTEHTDGYVEWVATKDQKLASRLVTAIIDRYARAPKSPVEPLPAFSPIVAGWSLFDVSAESVN